MAIDVHVRFDRDAIDLLNELARGFGPSLEERREIAAYTSYSIETVNKFFQDVDPPRPLVRRDVEGMSLAEMRGNIPPREMFRVELAVLIAGGATGEMFTRGREEKQNTTPSLVRVVQKFDDVLKSKFETAKLREWKMERLPGGGFGYGSASSWPADGEYDLWEDYWQEEPDELEMEMFPELP